MAIGLKQVTTVGNELALAFSDGFECYLPFAMLRRACPCAACQGEPDALGRVVKPKVEYGPMAFELTKYELVGGYAISLRWADGHSSGIYSFEYLRRLGEIPESGSAG